MKRKEAKRMEGAEEAAERERGHEHRTWTISSFPRCRSFAVAFFSL